MSGKTFFEIYAVTIVFDGNSAVARRIILKIGFSRICPFPNGNRRIRSGNGNLKEVLFFCGIIGYGTLSLVQLTFGSKFPYLTKPVIESLGANTVDFTPFSTGKTAFIRRTDQF